MSLLSAKISKSASHNSSCCIDSHLGAALYDLSHQEAVTFLTDDNDEVTL